MICVTSAYDWEPSRIVLNNVSTNTTVAILKAGYSYNSSLETLRARISLIYASND